MELISWVNRWEKAILYFI